MICWQFAAGHFKQLFFGIGELWMLDKLAIVGACGICLLMAFVGVNHDAYLLGWKSIALYLGAPATIVAGICSAFLLPREWRQTLFISGLSVVAGVYLFEAFLWYDMHRDRLPSDSDKRTRLQVIDQYRTEGIRAYPSVTPRMISLSEARGALSTKDGLLLPLGGIANSQIVHCRESRTWRIYPSDEHGFANPRGIWGLADIDIMAVGDSYTHGACVPVKKDFVAIIQQQYPKTLGVGGGGNGPLTELATIREYVAVKRPRTVVWFYFENDLQDLFREKRHPLLRGYLNTSFQQGLFNRQSEIDMSLKSFVESQYREARSLVSESDNKKIDFLDLIKFGDGANPLAFIPALTLPLTRRKFGLTFAGGEWPAPDTATFRKILMLARDEIRGWGGRLFFVMIPEWNSVILGDQRKMVYYDAARKVAEELRITVIDLAPVVLDHPDPRSLWPNRGPGHFGETGHALVGQIVVDTLLAAGIQRHDD